MLDVCTSLKSSQNSAKCIKKVTVNSQNECFFFFFGLRQRTSCILFWNAQNGCTFRSLPDMRNDLKWTMELAGLAQFFKLIWCVVCNWREQKCCAVSIRHTWLRSTMTSAESSPAGGMQGLLLRLHAALSEEDSRSAALTCHDIVGDLGHECMQVLTENELGKGFNCNIDEARPCLQRKHSATGPNFIYKLYHWCYSCFCDNLGGRCRIVWMSTTPNVNSAFV